MNRLLLAAVIALTAAPVPAAREAQPVRVLIETEAGQIEAEIDTVRAPITAANFLKYVDAGLFDGGRFFRTVRPDNQTEKPVKIAVIQAAGSRDRRAEFFPAIPLERTSVTGLSHKDGTLSMARAGARHRARIVFDLRGRPAVARFRRRASARRPGVRRLRTRRPRHGRRAQDSDVSGERGDADARDLHSQDQAAVTGPAEAGQLQLPVVSAFRRCALDD